MSYRPKKQYKPPYVYTTSQNELNYKILIIPEKAGLRDRIKENNGYCVSRDEKIQANRCMCEQFLNRDSEGKCKCGLYQKVRRTKAEIESYAKKTEWDETAEMKRIKKQEADDARKNPKPRMEDEA
jgi:hypothetical protein